MAQQQIYKKDINRELNPAVKVSNFDLSTIKIEIEEYVFTDEILNGLFKILEAIRNRDSSHIGIWIDGYFGSGKSHFLKYLTFCLDKRFKSAALDRLKEAVKEFDPLTNTSSKLAYTIADFNNLVDWLTKAEVDTILFDIADKVGDETTGESTTFVKAIWEEFNGFRGFNKFHIALAQYLEKPLKEKGKFDDFKAALANDGFDWETAAEDLATTELDYLMETAAQVSGMSTDAIRERIIKKDIALTPEKLGLELKSYIANKGEDYRLLFFIDEISQFVGSRQQLLLQLQSIVGKLAEDCDRKVWVGCTAQQDISAVVDGCKINKTSEDYGKIMGRFQVRVQLQGKDTEYITQKRVLEKDEDAVVELGKLYDKKANALDAQFTMPTGYRKYADKQDFINCYPFVPYQFQLIMNVFDAFVALQYVDTQIKGNERSVLKITHKTAKDHSGDEIGKLISFDMMYSSMFEGELKYEGQKAIRNARDVINEYQDKEFGMRVVKVLFMLCNISDQNKLLFPATLDNLVTLMMTEIDQSKLQLSEKISKVIEYLKDKSIIRIEKNATTGAEVYCFLTEEESEVNRLIMSQNVNSNAMADALRTIFSKYINVNNKENYNGNVFSVCMSIMDRIFIGQTSNNLSVEFKLDSQYPNPQQFALSNDPKKLVYYISDLYQADSKLKNDFYWYCKVQEYLRSSASSATEKRASTNVTFRERASELLESSIRPGFNKILDNCTLVSGQQILQPAILGSKKGTERYKAAMGEHFKNVYPLASYIAFQKVPTTTDDLKSKIRRQVQPDEYGPLNPLCDAETELENFFNRAPGDPELSDVIAAFSQAPYGWNEIATAYFVNELIRRHMRAFSYKGNPNVDKNFVADTILKEKTSYTITRAQQVSPQLVNDFIKAWKDIFNQFGKNYSLDSSELFNECHNADDCPLVRIPVQYAKISGELTAHNAGALAAILDKAIDKVNKWKAERDPEKFFKLVLAEKDEAKQIMDSCKDVMSFKDSQLSLFSEIYNFAEANKDNFDFITNPEDVKLVTELKAIAKDERPDQNLPSYKKRRDILRAKLDEIKKALVQKIKSNYETVFKELEDFAQSNGGTFNRNLFQNSVDAKCTTNNFYALESNANVSQFKQQQVALILNSIKKPTETDSNNGNVPPAPPVKIKRGYIQASQICKAKSIRSIDDLNNYVNEIKQKLVSALGDNDELIVS